MFKPLVAVVVLLVPVAGYCANPKDDAHDQIVYGRYSRKLQPSRLKYDFFMKHQELDHPATRADVEQGRAIFSLEGMGETRGWKLPKCPIFSTWPALKDFPYKDNTGEVHYRNHGCVCQAEELLVNNKWKRYFGFLCESGATVVPADQINLSIPYEDGPVSIWENLPGGLDWGVAAPGYEFRDGKMQDRKLKVGEPLLVTVYVRNRRGDQQELPTGFYRDAKAGGPALREGVTLHLERAPFDPRTPNSQYPGREHYKPIEPTRRDHYAGKSPVQLLKTGESVKAFELDLRDWFAVDQPGYYQFHFEFDPKRLDLPNEEREGAVQCSYGFTVGTPPPRLTFAQLNESIEPLGGKGTEARLRKLIVDTVPPATRPAAGTSRPAAEPPWSQPVGGLTARVEYVDWHSYAGLVVLVHLKNVSNAPLTVPMGNAVDSKAPRTFELHVQRGELPWKWIAWFPMEAPANEDRGGWHYGAEMTGNVAPRAPVVLGPGESAIAYLCGTESDDVKQASRIKIVIRQPAGAGWQGILETPPHPARPTGELGAARSAMLPFPRHFPEFSRVRFMGGNMGGHESAVERLSISNRALANALILYEADAVRLELERRIVAEKDEAMRLYLAALAAPRGSTAGALAMLEAMKSTEYETVTSVHGALELVFYRYDSKPPEWLVELAIAALADQRYATGEKAGSGSLTISYLADEYGGLTRALAHFKCRQAIPVLTEMVRRNQARGAIDALGDIGGGLPVVLEVLRNQEKDVAINKIGLLSPESFTFAVRAAGQLKAREAVPILLRHLCYEDVVEALEAIGNPAAIPALEKVVADGTPQPVEGETTESIQNSVWAARIALATLKEGDPLPRYWPLLADRSMGEYARRTVVWRLGSRPDARSVPHLVTAIKTDPSGAVVNQAIDVLSVFKYKSAVAGLINCFDADFDRKQDWKRAFKPEMFRENIAESLRAITGQAFGPDKEQWAKWWREQGEKQSDLK